MTPVTPVSSVSSSGASTAANLEAIALLQAQMLRYALTAIAESGPPNADYTALQAAIKSGNVSEAQTALSRLQRDTQAASSSASSPASANATSSSPAAGGTGATESSTEHSLDTTA